MASESSVSNTHKTLYCIRHAQSEYNEAVRNPKTWCSPTFWWNLFDPKIRDPLLSTKGQKQINDVANQLDSCSFLQLCGIDLIVTSPLQRALDTMLGIFKHQMDVIRSNQIPLIAHNELREWVDTLGDIGNTKCDLMRRYTDVDFSSIDNDLWWQQHVKENNGIIKESKRDVKDRISAFKHWILQREETNIVVVGHSRWLRELVGSTSKLNNCQMMKVELH
eukprot:407754_1